MKSEQIVPYKYKYRRLSPLRVAYKKNNELGVDNIKAILTIAITFFEDLVQAIKTRNYFRLFEIVSRLLQFGNILAVAQQAWEEFKDLKSSGEAQEVVDHFAVEFDIANDQLEAKIESALSLLPRIYDLAIGLLGIAADAKDIYDEAHVIFMQTTEPAAKAA